MPFCDLLLHGWKVLTEYCHREVFVVARDSLVSAVQH